MTKVNWKKGVRVFTASAAILLCMQMPQANANDLSELKNEKQQVENKNNELNTTIQQKESELLNNVEAQQKAIEQIQALTVKMADNNKKLDKLTQDIEQKNNEIAALEASIKELIRKIEERDALLQERARAIQASGSMNYLDVLLGASSFTDFIDRFSAVNTLIDADRQIMLDQEKDKKRLEDERKQLEEVKQQLEAQKAEAEKLREILLAQKAEKDRRIAELEAAEKQLKQEKSALEVEHEENVQLTAEIEQKIIAEQERIAEIARQQAEKKAAEAQAQAAQQQTKSSSTSNAPAATGPVPQVSAGAWTRPTTGTITSQHGLRNLGGSNEYHYGLDIGNAAGTPVVAAADGVVSHAAPLGGYGNLVMISHVIDGEVFTTVYAHLNGFNVSQGQTVSKGQQIGIMGSTGRSTGPHLHFEIHTGPWQGQQVNNINPMYYIPF